MTAWKATALVRLFGWTKIPMIAYLRPRVLRQDGEETVVVIPLSRRAKNHHGSMYMGALAVGGDLASGLQAMLAIRGSGHSVSFVFKDARMEFLRRPDGAVHFWCGQGAAVREMVAQAIADGKRHNMALDVVATVPGAKVSGGPGGAGPTPDPGGSKPVAEPTPGPDGAEPVARMRFTLSVKAR